MNRTCRSLPASSQGFTLIEMLIVIGVISVLAAIGWRALASNNPGQALATAESMSSSLFQNARSLALRQNAPVRVLVNSDPVAPGQYLRTLSLVVGSEAENGAMQWRAAQKVEQLPQGIYFDPNLSNGDGSGAPLPTMKLELPKHGPQPEGRGQQWYYYELNAQGMATSSNGALYVLSPGRLSENGELIRPNDTAVRGFVLRQLGTLTRFDFADRLFQ